MTAQVFSLRIQISIDHHDSVEREAQADLKDPYRISSRMCEMNAAAFARRRSSNRVWKCKI